MLTSHLRILGGFFRALVILWLSLLCGPGHSCALETIAADASGAQINMFFAATKQRVLTFVGYSGAGYQDQAQMLTTAGQVLDGFEPATTIVNIGATREGIGAVYDLAKKRGFYTTGIVSTQAKKYASSLSPCVDRVFYVEDASWGGVVDGTDQLSPTSAAMVTNSDEMVGIGGGAVARDELRAAQQAGKPVLFFAADMSHKVAKEKAARGGRTSPVDFRGAASIALATTATRTFDNGAEAGHQ